MYTLYIANKNYSSWSLRPWILMTELNITFQEQQVVFSGDSNWEAFRRFSPSGTVPCLLAGPLTVWDSMAITEFLAERHEGVWPDDGTARAWARCAAAEMHAGFGVLRRQCPMNCGLTVRLGKIDAALQHDISRVDELWREGLSRFGGPFLAGRSFTAVDAFYAPVVFRIHGYGLAMSEEAGAYARRLQALGSMQSWERQALAEPWRETNHEQEVLATGVILEDRRQR